MGSIPENLEKRLKRCTNFPSPPPVALKVIELAQNPKTDLRLVADTCSGDPAIAAKIMKIANSALYTSRRQSTNLRQALIVLGLNATLTLALSFTLVAGLRRDPPKGFDFLSYWRRAILAATWAKLLSTELGQPFAEESFIAALLQDIGMLAIDRLAPHTYDTVSPTQFDHLRLAQHEINELGADHAAIGGWLLNSWKLPDGLVDAVANSHNLDFSGDDPERENYYRVVAASGMLADAWLSGGDELTMQRVAVTIEKQLGILPSRIAELFAVIGEQLPIASELFEMDLFEDEDISDICDAARETLMIRNLHTLSDAMDLQKRASVLQSENIALRQETTVDGLTGVGNRRFFEESLEKEFESANRHKWPLSLMFVDLDYFKDINDNHGHPAGDEILREVAKLITRTLRADDIVARYGGDEFVVLLPGSDTEAVHLIADRLVTDALKCGESIGNSGITPTLSLGVVTMDSSNQFESAKALLKAADEALYYSKDKGRNQHTSYAQIKTA
ncbi:MAG: GGDEF domain-containing protein [Gammaproteobacteria bacterium]|nr:GGDEF domain-containing protein [Gammaproteobacteria bacterium]